MGMELSPNMGANLKQFECKLCTFFVHFDARKGFFVLNLLENIMDAGFFLCTTV